MSQKHFITPTIPTGTTGKNMPSSNYAWTERNRISMTQNEGSVFIEHRDHAGFHQSLQDLPATLLSAEVRAPLSLLGVTYTNVDLEARRVGKQDLIEVTFQSFPRFPTDVKDALSDDEWSRRSTDVTNYLNDWNATSRTPLRMKFLNLDAYRYIRKAQDERDRIEQLESLKRMQKEQEYLVSKTQAQMVEEKQYEQLELNRRIGGKTVAPSYQRYLEDHVKDALSYSGDYIKSKLGKKT